MLLSGRFFREVTGEVRFGEGLGGEEGRGWSAWTVPTVPQRMSGRGPWQFVFL